MEKIPHIYNSLYGKSPVYDYIKEYKDEIFFEVPYEIGYIKVSKKELLEHFLPFAEGEVYLDMHDVGLVVCSVLNFSEEEYEELFE